MRFSEYEAWLTMLTTWRNMTKRNKTLYLSVSRSARTLQIDIDCLIPDVNFWLLLTYRDQLTACWVCECCDCMVCWQRVVTTSSSVPTLAAVSQQDGSVTATTTVETCPTNRTAASPHRRPVRTIRQSPPASRCFALLCCEDPALPRHKTAHIICNYILRKRVYLCVINYVVN